MREIHLSAPVDPPTPLIMIARQLMDGEIYVSKWKYMRTETEIYNLKRNKRYREVSDLSESSIEQPT